MAAGRTEVELFEVLTEASNGHRTVHRVRAKNRKAAETALGEMLDGGVGVLGTSPASRGLGSG